MYWIYIEIYDPIQIVQILIYYTTMIFSPPIGAYIWVKAFIAVSMVSCGKDINWRIDNGNTFVNRVVERLNFFDIDKSFLYELLIVQRTREFKICYMTL